MEGLKQAKKHWEGITEKKKIFKEIDQLAYPVAAGNASCGVDEMPAVSEGLSSSLKL